MSVVRSMSTSAGTAPACSEQWQGWYGEPTTDRNGALGQRIRTLAIAMHCALKH
jgi:hypothetical protein